METATLVKLRSLSRVVSGGYHAAFLVIGGSRFFLLADFLFIYDAVIDPIFSGRKFRFPSIEIIGLAVLVAVTSLWSHSANDGFQTAIRIYVLALVLPTYKYGFKFKQVLGASLGAVALLAIFQSSYNLRPDGIHVNASLLAQSALVWMPVFWLELGIIGAIIITVSMSRNPLIAFIIFAIVSRQQYFYYLAAITAAMFLVYVSIFAPDRISISGLDSAVTNRIETVTGLDDETLEKSYGNKCGIVRPVELRWQGYGFGGFCEATGQPRPHNVFVVTYYEMGVFAIPFWALIVWAGRRLRLVQWLPLLALGMVTESLVGRPEGVYLIASWIIATNLMRKSPTPAAHTIPT